MLWFLHIHHDGETSDDMQNETHHTSAEFKVRQNETDHFPVQCGIDHTKSAIAQNETHPKGRTAWCCRITFWMRLHSNHRYLPKADLSNRSFHPFVL